MPCLSDVLTISAGSFPNKEPFLLKEFARLCIYLKKSKAEQTTIKKSRIDISEGRELFASTTGYAPAAYLHLLNFQVRPCRADFLRISKATVPQRQMTKIAAMRDDSNFNFAADSFKSQILQPRSPPSKRVRQSNPRIVLTLAAWKKEQPKDEILQSRATLGNFALERRRKRRAHAQRMDVRAYLRCQGDHRTRIINCDGVCIGIWYSHEVVDEHVQDG